MALPYRILLICLLLAGITFSLGPWWAMQSISKAAIADNKEQWQKLVKPEAFESYTEKMLSGLLELKMVADSKENPGESNNRTSKQPKCGTQSRISTDPSQRLQSFAVRRPVQRP